MTDQELDEILTLHWPVVVRSVMGDARTEDFFRGFARSIARHGKRPDWRPSPAQERIMRQMLRDFAGPSRMEPEPDLIERD